MVLVTEILGWGEGGGVLVLIIQSTEVIRAQRRGWWKTGKGKEDSQPIIVNRKKTSQSMTDHFLPTLILDSRFPWSEVLALA